MSGGSSPGRSWEFFLHHYVQAGSEAHQVPYPVDTRCSFLGVKHPVHEADQSPQSNAVKNVWSIPPFPNTPSWRGARLKQRVNITLTVYWRKTVGNCKIVCETLSLHQKYQHGYQIAVVCLTYMHHGAWYSLKSW